MPESNTQTSNNRPDFSGPVEINFQTPFSISESLVRQVVSAILVDAGYRKGAISIAIVDDPSIHQLNVQYLQHDYPTDVLSFVLDSDRDAGWLEGEVIVSSDTAARQAPDFGWRPADELMLYVVHGTLHLAGMDDSSDELRQAMQRAETRYLAEIGIERGTAGHAQGPGS